MLFDDNGISIDGATTLAQSDDVTARFAAYGWHVISCDGHDEKALANAMQEAIAADKPTLIACKTVIGFGAPTKQGTAAAHGAALGEEEVAAARRALVGHLPPLRYPMIL